MEKSIDECLEEIYSKREMLQSEMLYKTGLALEDVGDLFDKAVAKFYTKFEEYTQSSPLMPYFSTIYRNAVYDNGRKVARRLKKDHSGENVEDMADPRQRRPIDELIERESKDDDFGSFLVYELGDKTGFATYQKYAEGKTAKEINEARVENGLGNAGEVTIRTSYANGLRQLQEPEMKEKIRKRFLE
ncbi:MAG: DNA-directed RNA polymerase specialized sigma24 family protein [Patescibacteria group bacterium]|jgi:DNA-directed RNA polymerase specialized sigma24 family protein